MSETLIPACVFHASQVIADESIERGWSIWDFANRVSARLAGTVVFGYQLYAACGPEDPNLLLSADDPADLERVFGISAEFWQRIESACRALPDRVVPLDEPARAWYGLDDEVESAPASTEAER